MTTQRALAKRPFSATYDWRNDKRTEEQRMADWAKEAATAKAKK